MLLFCPKHITQANTLGWHLFKHLKPDQGVYKLPPTQGDWSEHIRRVHVQASVWSQDLVVNPVVPDPVTLGWQLKDGKLLSLLTNLFCLFNKVPDLTTAIIWIGLLYVLSMILKIFPDIIYFQMHLCVSPCFCSGSTFHVHVAVEHMHVHNVLLNFVICCLP